MHFVKVKMLRWIYGLTRNDKSRNEVIQEKMTVASVTDKLSEVRLRLFEHVKRKCINAPVRQCEVSCCKNIET